MVAVLNETVLHSHSVNNKVYRIVKTPNYFRIEFSDIYDKNSYRSYTFIGLYTTLDEAAIELAGVLAVDTLAIIYG